MTLNGLIYSATLGYDAGVAIEALGSGALAAGLSGTGPAVAAVVPRNRVGSVKDAWGEYDGEVIETRVNSEKAHVVSW